MRRSWTYDQPSAEVKLNQLFQEKVISFQFLVLLLLDYKFLYLTSKEKRTFLSGLRIDVSRWIQSLLLSWITRRNRTRVRFSVGLHVGKQSQNDCPPLGLISCYETSLLWAHKKIYTLVSVELNILLACNDFFHYRPHFRPLFQRNFS